MALTKEEELELAELQKEFPDQAVAETVVEPTSGLTPEEEIELSTLQKEIGTEAPSGLTPEEETELATLQKEFPVEEFTELESGAIGARSEVTFGFYDEMVGAVDVVESLVTGDDRPMEEIYKAGRDEIRRQEALAEKANPKSYLAGQVVGGIATSFIPGLGLTKIYSAGKAATTAAKVGRAAAEGAKFGGLTAAGLSKAEVLDGDFKGLAKDIAIGSALGAGGGVILTGVGVTIGKVVGKLKVDPANAKIVADGALETTKQTGKEVSEAAVTDLAEGLAGKTGISIQKDANDKLLSMIERGDYKVRQDMALSGEDPVFIREMLGLKAGDKLDILEYKQFDQWLGQWQPNAQEKIFRNHMEAQALRSATTKVAKKLKTEFVLSDPTDISLLTKAMTTSSQQARKVDNEIGSNFTGIVENYIHAENAVSRSMLNPIKKAKEVKTAIRKHLNPAKFYDAYTKGELGSLPDKYAQTGQLVKAYFADQRKLLREAGLGIGDLGGNYLPRRSKSLSDLRPELDSINRKLKGNYSTTEGQELIDTLQFITGRKISTKVQVDSAIDDLINKQTMKNSARREGFMSFHRKDSIPELMLEKDVSKLMADYANSGWKAIHFREPTEHLSQHIKTAKSLGMDQTADYFDTFAKRMAGAPSDHFANTMITAGKFKTIGQRLIDDNPNSPIIRFFGQSTKNMPDMVSYFMGQAYPNALAANPVALVRNLFQPVLVGGTDIMVTVGPKYAAQATSKGYIKAFNSYRKSKNKGDHMSEFLREKGIKADSPAEDVHLDAITNGLRDWDTTSGGKLSKAFGVVGKNYEKLTNGFMKFYQATDTANRFVTYHVGEEIAEGILRKDKSAMKFLNDLPKGLKANANMHLQTGDTEALKKLVINHTVKRHQYAYNKADLTALGRDYGKMATMFTKWPLEQIGDMRRLVHEQGKFKGYSKTFLKHMATVGVLYSMESSLDALNVADTPVKKFLVGDNMVKFSPAWSMFITPPPPISAGIDIGKAMAIEGKQLFEKKGRFSKKIEKLRAKVVKPLELFMPGYGLWKNVTRRLDKADIINLPSQ